MSGTQETAVFTMEASAASFHVMSDSLYPDKIKAVVRELSCNAYDSHVMAGCVDTQFEVKLPSVFDLMFHVRDFGTGLSHEDTMGLYSTYFKSTKTKSDLFIGQLGLGSKSPFSYAHTFNVESWFNGEKRTYTCYKNDQDLPAITLMHTENNTEPNGLKVSMAVRASDIDAFTKAAKKVFATFIVQPNVIGVSSFAPYAITYSVSGADNRWALRASDTSGLLSGATITQGNVMYPIDAEQLQEAGVGLTGYTVASSNIDIRMSIGSVEVAPSRESLSYNRRTLATLVAEFNRIGRELETSFQARVDQCKSRWELYVFYQSMINSELVSTRSLFNMISKNGLNWKGLPVASKFIVDMSGIEGISIRTTENHEVNCTWSRRRASNKSMVKSTCSWESSKTQVMIVPGETELKSAWLLHITPATHLMVNDTGKRINAADIKAFVVEKQIKEKHYKIVLIEPDAGQYTSSGDVINELVTRINPPVVLKLSDIPHIPSTNKAKPGQLSIRQKREKSSKLVWNSFSNRRALSNWTTHQIDMTAGGFYIPIVRYTDIQINVDTIRIDRCIAAAKTLNIIPADAQLVGLTSVALAKLPVGHNWINMFDYIAEVVTVGHQTSGQFTVERTNDQIHQCISTPIIDVIKAKRSSKRSIVEGEFKTILDAMDDAYKPVNSDIIESLNVLCVALNLGVGSATNFYAVELEKKWQDTIAKYDILTIMNWTNDYSYNTKTMRPSYDQLINYVNLVDSNRVGVTVSTV